MKPLPGLLVLVCYRARVWWLTWRIRRGVERQARLVDALRALGVKVKALDPDAR